jgi:hypothetical protein
MIGKVLAVVAGMTGAAGVSQFPEYSQQYTQRLAGAVDELQRIVDGFDQDADALGLSREAALVSLAQGGDVGVARAERVAQTIARHQRLSGDLGALRQAGPFMRAYQAGRFSDGDIARAAWRDFRPAVPVSFEGFVFSAVGFVCGLIMMWAIWATLRLPFRMRSRKRADLGGSG